MDDLFLAESQGLERKGREALRRPVQIAREVVAMLNTESGGRILVGMSDAGDLEPIEDAELHVRRLRDCFVECIEPPPPAGSVEVRVRPVHGSEIIEVLIHSSPGRRAFALLQSGARSFVIRVDDRIRPMHRTELEERIRAVDSAAPSQRERLERWLTEAGAHPPTSGVWIAIVLPESRPRPDLQSRELRDLCTKPELSNNRSGGWSVVSEYGDEELRSRRIDFGIVGSHDGKRARALTVMIDEEAWALCYEASLARVQFRRTNGERLNELHPLALIELPTSMTRLAAALLRHYPVTNESNDSIAWMELHIRGIPGWALRPFSPGRWGFESPAPGQARQAEEEDLAVRRAFTITELTTDPDACGFALVRELYQAFGHREEVIPPEFDRRTKRLVIGA